MYDVFKIIIMKEMKQWQLNYQTPSGRSNSANEKRPDRKCDRILPFIVVLACNLNLWIIYGLGSRLFQLCIRLGHARIAMSKPFLQFVPFLALVIKVF